MDHYNHMNFQYIKHQREEMENYVHERLRDHFAISSAKSPPSLGYGTFKPGSGTSRSGSPRNGGSNSGYPRTVCIFVRSPISEANANISTGKHTAR